jgi:hypothetical protein
MEDLGANGDFLAGESDEAAPVVKDQAYQIRRRAGSGRISLGR